MADLVKSGVKFRVFSGKDEQGNMANWNIMSFWGKAEDCELSNGSSVEDILGDMDGITSSPTSVSDHTAASALLVNTLSGELAEIDIDMNSWSNSTSSVTGIGDCYTRVTGDITASNVILEHPLLYLLPSDGALVPTKEQYETFMDLELIVSKSDRKIKLYSYTKPTATIKIGIKGVLL